MYRRKGTAILLAVAFICLLILRFAYSDLFSRFDFLPSSSSDWKKFLSKEPHDSIPVLPVVSRQNYWGVPHLLNLARSSDERTYDPALLFLGHPNYTYLAAYQGKHGAVEFGSNSVFRSQSIYMLVLTIIFIYYFESFLLITVDLSASLQTPSWT